LRIYALRNFAFFATPAFAGACIAKGISYMKSKPKYQPAIEKAKSAILDKLKAGDIAPGERLPSSRDLAAGLGVSLVSMWKALKQLQREGVCTGRRGDGFRLARIAHESPGKKHPAREPLSSLHRPSWKKIAAIIERDLYQGRYRRGNVFPSRKELSLKYGVSYQTLAKAFDFLVSQQLLIPHGKSFTVAQWRAGSSSGAASRIVLYMPAFEDGSLNLGVFGEELCRTIERECAASALCLDVVTYYASDDTDIRLINFRTGKQAAIEDSNNIFGYIILYMREGWESLVKQISRFRKPVAVHDDLGEFSLPASRGGYRNVRSFTSSAGHDHARAVARRLLAGGHTGIAYISPFHRAQWSQNRLEGLRAVFSSAGYEGQPREYVLDDFSARLDYYSHARSKSNSESMQSVYSQWRNAIPVDYCTRMDRHFGAEFEMLLSEAEAYRQVKRLCSKALGDASITAWIAANDLTAVMALEFLREARVAVPEKISLISFDDSSIAVTNNLTSYNFNLSTVAAAMISHALNRSIPGQYKRAQKIYISGTVIERGTVANFQH
jgi:DNA-binding LacI/PurR family transcriptional regulator/DNA-binding transcriptional regulator YhcF (GntR family)